MPRIPGLDAVENLISTFARDNRLLSTGAEVVNYSGDLYNVAGSTPDPPAVPGHSHSSWKILLKEMANLHEQTPCYVTNVDPPSDSSHPLFKVGGHMTPNESGEVAHGGICYLMPLCSWHNSTRRNGVAFEHTQTKMLKLTGFMEGDSPITFRLRQPSLEPFALLLFDEDNQEWRTTNLPSDDPSTIKAATIKVSKKPLPFRVLLERLEDGLYIKDSLLPK